MPEVSNYRMKKADAAYQYAQNKLTDDHPLTKTYERIYFREHAEYWEKFGKTTTVGPFKTSMYSRYSRATLTILLLGGFFYVAAALSAGWFAGPALVVLSLSLASIFLLPVLREWVREKQRNESFIVNRLLDVLLAGTLVAALVFFTGPAILVIASVFILPMLLALTPFVKPKVTEAPAQSTPKKKAWKIVRVSTAIGIPIGMLALFKLINWQRGVSLLSGVSGFENALAALFGGIGDFFVNLPQFLSYITSSGAHVIEGISMIFQSIATWAPALETALSSTFMPGVAPFIAPLLVYGGLVALGLGLAYLLVTQVKSIAQEIGDARYSNLEKARGLIDAAAGAKTDPAQSLDPSNPSLQVDGNDSPVVSSGTSGTYSEGRLGPSAQDPTAPVVPTAPVAESGSGPISPPTFGVTPVPPADLTAQQPTAP
jgi:hypothetical protein